MIVRIIAINNPSVKRYFNSNALRIFVKSDSTLKKESKVTIAQAMIHFMYEMMTQPPFKLLH